MNFNGTNKKLLDKTLYPIVFPKISTKFVLLLKYIKPNNGIKIHTKIVVTTENNLPVMLAL